MRDREGMKNQQAVQLVSNSQGLLQGSPHHHHNLTHTHTWTHIFLLHPLTLTHTHKLKLSTIAHCLAPISLCILTLPTSSPPTFPFFTFAVSVIFLPPLHFFDPLAVNDEFPSTVQELAEKSLLSKVLKVK